MTITLTDIFYHLAPIPLDSESIILPGNFGRIINKTGTSHYLFAREMLLERIRIKEFKNKSSRLKSCFMFLNEEEARFYKQRVSGYIHHLIYKVKILNLTAQYHIGCHAHLPPNAHGVGITNASPEIVAKQYWEGQLTSFQDCLHLKLQELIVESPIKIINCIQD